MGFIYILTNPSFPQYVKIGYATDVNQRLDELNRSTAVPFAFRVYATYEVDSALSDKKVHSILDKLNPDLVLRNAAGGCVCDSGSDCRDQRLYAPSEKVEGIGGRKERGTACKSDR